MAETKITLDLLLTKLAPIFKKDCYILNNHYIIPGKSCEDVTPSTLVAILNENSSQMIKETFQTEENIYIKDIKNAKKDENEIIRGTIGIPDIRESKYSFILKDYKWNKLILTEEEMEKLFVDGDSISLALNKETEYQLTKALLPGITKSMNIPIYYTLWSITDNKVHVTIDYFLIMYDLPYFRLFNLINYIRV